MLSFDITDRNIRVVKGVETSGKIKITSAATVNVEEGIIVNGHVKDVPNVATRINNVLKMNKMPDNNENEIDLLHLIKILWKKYHLN